jgi:hypothetical protein
LSFEQEQFDQVSSASSPASVSDKSHLSTTHKHDSRTISFLLDSSKLLLLQSDPKISIVDEKYQLEYCLVIPIDANLKPTLSNFYPIWVPLSLERVL